MRTKPLLTLLTALAFSASTAATREQSAAPFTVSGISSGAYMATQVHLALSSRVDGAALLAAGPYGCAEGNIMNALGRCISGKELSAPPLAERARALAEGGEIDALSGLAADPVWLFHGQGDAVVAHAVAEATQAFYLGVAETPNVAFIDNVPVAHGWPTLDQGVECGTMGGDFINACDYDAAGELLHHIYGDLQARGEMVAEHLQHLPQSGVVPENAGFADAGFAYVPGECQAAADCRIHVAFHGCRQGSQFIEDRFARQAGLNEWAETNRIVVLYPQVVSSMVNPQGCWDWWGYTGADYDTRAGAQVAGIAALVDQWSRQ